MAANVKQELPALAQYRELREYTPSYGDYIVRVGWFTTTHGVVSNFNPDSSELSIIFGGVPYVLFTLEEDEQEKRTEKIKLSKIRSARHGSWAVLHHDYTRNANIWFI